MQPPVMNTDNANSGGPLPSSAATQQPGVFAAPATAANAPIGGITGVGQVTLSLCLVLAVIFAMAWLAKRMRGFGQGVRALNIVADVRLGPKERAVVLQVGAQQLLVGVAPGRVSTLHVLPEPLPPVASSSAPNGPNGPNSKAPSFGELLRRSLGK